jgi:hypothetical protein
MVALQADTIVTVMLVATTGKVALLRSQASEKTDEAVAAIVSR